MKTTKTTLTPERVTKPLQLLAAWLVGLITIDTAFLTAARFLTNPSWLPAFLAISAVVNVPLFLACLFFLQTRFRPQMQEDAYYSRYLEITQQREDPIDQVDQLRITVSESQNRTLALVDTIQRQVVGLVHAMESTRQQSAEALATVKALIPGTQRGLADAREDAVRQRFRVSVNILLPNYSVIVAGLEQAGIKISGHFGSETPTTYLTSFAPDIPPEFLREVLNAVGNPDFIGVSTQDINRGSIHIGSYAYKRRPVAQFSDIAALLASAATSEELVATVQARSKNLEHEAAWTDGA